jgi:hypothetical protein
MKVKFLKSMTYRDDNGIMRISNKKEVVDFQNEERIEEAIYSGQAIIVDYYREGYYKITTPFPFDIENFHCIPGEVIYLPGDIAADLVCTRRAIPVDPETWAPGRRTPGEVKKLYTTEVPESEADRKDATPV